MRTKHAQSFRRRMLFIIMLAFVPVIVVVTILFWQTTVTQQQVAKEGILNTAEEVSRLLEKTVSGVYSVSDSFSADERLISVIDKDYADESMNKLRVIAQILNAMFEGYNRLLPQERIDAIYVAPKKELFNFMQPDKDSEDVINELIKLDVNNKERLGKFYWFPLRENFLTDLKYGDARRDSVIIGSRRVYNHLKNAFRYVHIFVVEERTLYEQYRVYAQKSGVEIYILDSDNRLLSSSSEMAVASRALPEGLIQSVSADTEPVGEARVGGEIHNVAHKVSELNGWKTVVMVPKAETARSFWELYYKTFAVIILGSVICALLLLYLYRRFMEPMSEMYYSMEKVDEGDLRAYVHPRGQAEMFSMMKRYNKMLRSISRNTDERVRAEADKKDLEMQVLVSQINPHFLYNTLETIVWRANDVGSPDIGKIAASLGKLYRISIKGGLFVSLPQEIEHVRAYMNIQTMRYGERVSYCVKEPKFPIEEIVVLKLILQPVVENCLLYAMEGIDRRLMVRLKIKREGKVLKLIVTDNGIGMDREQLRLIREQVGSSDGLEAGRGGENGALRASNTKKHGSGIGLHNICARLSLYYGGESGVGIQSIKNLGTRVILTLPVETPSGAKITNKNTI